VVDFSRTQERTVEGAATVYASLYQLCPFFRQTNEMSKDTRMTHLVGKRLRLKNMCITGQEIYTK